MLEYRQMIEQHRKAESAERNKPRKEALQLAEKRREDLERWKRDRLRPRLTGSVGWNRRQKALAAQQAKWLGLPVIDPPSSHLAPPPPRSSASFRQPNPAPTPFQGPQRSLPSFLAAQEPTQPPKQATPSSPQPRPTEQPNEQPVGQPVSPTASNKPAAVAPLPQHLFVSRGSFRASSCSCFFDADLANGGLFYLPGSASASAPQANICFASSICFYRTRTPSSSRSSSFSRILHPTLRVSVRDRARSS